MSFFDFLKQPDIDAGVKEFQASLDAVLLDVRTPKEYAEGHIPGSKNVPLQELDQVLSVVEKKETPLFLYCRSGARSGQAASLLQRMGYTQVKNIGGILSYSGKVEK